MPPFVIIRLAFITYHKNTKTLSKYFCVSVICEQFGPVVFILFFRRKLFSWSNPKASSAQAAMSPRIDSIPFTLVTAKPTATPNIPKITELATCPMPQNRVINAVLVRDQPRAAAIIINGI
jgi:hypothetical protein